ncbi:Transforming growth factor-beta-induced protein ig-h3 Beta ig-h3 [Fibrella aestuarina BUZ 2]|uniref:Transforming growth factor-beta-induced protein ig-h3 Beta ig-h3 n=1 Tax=Fibrella aestuarina BUZ 2 TaxID=1166018 RepID=I0KAF8_9BACT|nr:fasciclin domain-containing protein [Fibrella aestuarina]CCH01111.1 Transforming growth factor-beta-induced protein ig-h3 Beta ig-h3 [Fibrella aestuarina BUZ 2]
MHFSQHPFRTLAGCLLLFVTLFASSCKKDDTPATQTNTITDIVQSDSRFTILRAAVIKAGLADALRSGSLTVFAPTDDAFRAAGITTDAISSSTAAQLTPILQYHVLNSRVPAANIPTAANTPQQTLLTTNGTVYITKTGNNVSVNGRRVTIADVPADNGVVHVIDGVLMPPTGDVVAAVIADPQNYSLLAQAVQRAGAGVITALQSTTAATLFAPTNQAFIDAGLSATAIAATPAATLQRVLSYHVVPGRVFSTQLTDGLTSPTLLGATPTLRFGVTGTGVTVTGAGNGTSASNVTSANILTTNAVIHRIDRVLLPGS